MKLERTPTGLVELRLSENPDDFRRIAEIVHRTLNGKWKQQLNGLDQSYWDLEVDGKILTVHREHYLGVSVFCDGDEAKVQLLKKLKSFFEVNKPN